MTETQISSPVKEIPDCWLDDNRMNVLFSPFRKRELNPVGFDSKMKFWNSVVLQWCMENNRCVLTLDILRKAFKRKERMPSCLLTVIEELLRTGDLKDKNEFLNMRVVQPSWTNWAMNNVIWSLSKLKDALYVVETDELQYVHIGYLKKKGEAVLCAAQQTPEKDIYTTDDLRMLIGSPECSSETIDLLIHWLKLEGKISTTMCSDQEIIKLGILSGPVCISQKDIAEFKLAKSRKAQEDAIAYLKEEKQKALNDAKEHLSKGLRMAAKNSLRKKKALEECITKRLSTLDNIELLLVRIKDAQSDAEVYDSYKIGLSALKSTFKEAGLTEDNVINTITDLEEVNEMQDEIQNILAHQVQPTIDSELDEELISILSKVEQEGELKLPEVPSTQLVESTDRNSGRIEPKKFQLAE